MGYSNYFQKPQVTKQTFQCKSSGYTLRCWSEKFLNNSGKCQCHLFPNRTRSYDLIDEDGRQFCFRMKKKSSNQDGGSFFTGQCHGTKRFAIG